MLGSTVCRTVNGIWFPFNQDANSFVRNMGIACLTSTQFWTGCRVRLIHQGSLCPVNLANDNLKSDRENRGGPAYLIVKYILKREPVIRWGNYRSGYFQRSRDQRLNIQVPAAASKVANHTSVCVMPRQKGKLILTAVVWTR